ncbi:OmpH family outer membrane protein [uncultured Dialister sp.]|uniref:OmpH family outer membrane protein n=1 Tax=uncultured Dialister sp. TaxID=278064 RepID=UPI0025F2FE8C|nr:OmpH family outer membrane protein [uncultured Dialister sp.]
MMTTLGNKKNVKIFSFALAGVFIASVAVMAVVSMGDTASAAPTTDIGVVDQREVISSNGQLAIDYQTKMKQTAEEMQKDFDAKSAGMSDADKEKLFADMQQQFNQKRTAIEKDMEDQVTGAVKSVASKKGLSLVVDKSAVIYGGTDITREVSEALNKSVSSAQSVAASQSK